MNLVNLTPHTLHMHRPDGTVIAYPSEGIARVALGSVVVEHMDGIPVRVSTPGEVAGLPAPVSGTCYLVSRLLAEAVPGRTDLLFPDDVVRDGEGKLVGCRAWGRAK